MTESIFETYQALHSMRNAPYTTVTALAELIDNSLQNDAKNIKVFGGFEKKPTKAGTKNYIQSIGIYDDGKGMDIETLKQCLKVGFSRHKEELNGLGKFGFGLSIASLSQAYRVEVYSWQNSGDIMYTYLDLDEIKDKKIDGISEPEKINMYPYMGQKYLPKTESGTVVLWSKLDQNKLEVQTERGIVNNLDEDLGRIYRHFLDDDETYGNKVKLSLMAFDDQFDLINSKDVLPNDPMYILTPNRLPSYENKDYKNEAIFTEFNTHSIPVQYEDDQGKTKESNVEIKITRIKASVLAQLRKGAKNPGNTPVGKELAKNQGVSIVRAGREIKLDDSWCIPETTERWWGCEIRFEPVLDKFFGLSNDKQSVSIFKKIPDGWQNYYDEALDDPKKAMNVALNKFLKSELNRVRGDYSQGVEGSRSSQRKDDPATRISDDLKKDKNRKKTLREKEADKKDEKTIYQEILDEVKKKNPTLDEEEIKEIAKDKANKVIDLVTDQWAGSVFLDVVSRGLGAQGKINIEHKFYKAFYKDFEEKDDKAFRALRILLMAYVRAEDELSEKYDPDNEIFPALREAWGRLSKDYIDI